MSVAEDQESGVTRDDPAELSDSAARGSKSAAVLTLLRGDKPGTLYFIDRHSAALGRSPECEVMINDDSLSRRHASIYRAADVFMIEDLGSKNGTFVDGTRVEKPHVLDDGCRIALGSRIVLHFGLRDAVELEAARHTQALTLRDPLTGTFNRGHLEERLSSEAAYAVRHKSSLSLLLLDVDHFKQINDTYGHSAGDSALRVLAQVLSDSLREEDLLARYGGEEFAVVARGISREETIALAERMRQRVGEQSVSTESGSFSFTVSIGVAHADRGEGCTARAMFETADRALYAAKD
ncbi:MAG TPA: GGDEF domain-containing protein, partial [Polyangiales bacterium]|nr:GGDEF domain-containing protein [Polyangiales bacterium]